MSDMLKPLPRQLFLLPFYVAVVVLTTAIRLIPSDSFNLNKG